MCVSACLFVSGDGGVPVAFLQLGMVLLRSQPPISVPPGRQYVVDRLGGRGREGWCVRV